MERAGREWGFQKMQMILVINDNVILDILDIKNMSKVE